MSARTPEQQAESLERQRQSRREWNRRNSERVRETHRAWSQRNRERIREYKREWRKREGSRELERAINARSAARKAERANRRFMASVWTVLRGLGQKVVCHWSEYRWDFGQPGRAAIGKDKLTGEPMILVDIHGDVTIFDPAMTRHIPYSKLMTLARLATFLKEGPE